MIFTVLKTALLGPIGWIPTILGWVGKNPLLAMLAVSLAANYWFYSGREKARNEIIEQRQAWELAVVDAKKEARKLQAEFDQKKIDIVTAQAKRFRAALVRELERSKKQKELEDNLRRQLDDLRKQAESRDWLDSRIPNAVVDWLRVPAGSAGDSDENRDSGARDPDSLDRSTTNVRRT